MAGPPERKESRVGLLQTLPQYWDSTDLPTYLRTRANDIGQICGIRGDTTQKIIERFAREDAEDQTTFHDKTRYLTIQFEQEGVSDKTAPQGGYHIDARQVVKNLSLALQYLQEGAGAEIGGIANQRHMYPLLDPRHMTLDWQGSTLYPALRYEKEVTRVNNADLNTLVRCIQTGRQNVAARASAYSPQP
jgi:hypothetical protein